MTAAATSASTRAVDRALDLLTEVCTKPGASLSECARSAALSPSTALRLLRTLEAKGFVVRDPDGVFHSGPRLVQLGAAAFGRQSLVTLAEPVLQRLVAACGESAYLSVRGPGETAVYIAMVEGTHPIRHTGWVGRTVQLRGTAIGHAMRAAVSDSAEKGYVAQQNQLEHDVTAIAAPVRRSPALGRAGAVAAVLSVVGPSYRIDDKRMSELGVLVANEAQRLTDQLAGVRPATGSATAAGKRQKAASG